MGKLLFAGAAVVIVGAIIGFRRKQKAKEMQAVLDDYAQPGE